MELDQYQQRQQPGANGGSPIAYNVSSLTYMIPNLTAGASDTVRLHFRENFWTAAGQRVFNVSINDQWDAGVNNFDVYKTAGGQSIANIEQFTATANSSGQIVIVFTSGTDNAMVSGVEIDGAGKSAPATPTASAATSITGSGFNSARRIWTRAGFASD